MTERLFVAAAALTIIVSLAVLLWPRCAAQFPDEYENTTSGPRWVRARPDLLCTRQRGHSGSHLVEYRGEFQASWPQGFR